MATGWNAAKVEAFKESFADFLGRIRIDSKDTGGGTVLGENIYYSQQRFLDGVWDALSNDIHDIKALKSRQLGISTICKPLVLFWMGVHDGLQGAMIFDTDAHKEAARRDIETMIRELHEYHPDYKFPTIERSNRYGFLLSNRSFLHFMAAGVRNQRSSGVLGRSSGLSLIWASEVCSWDNVEGLISLRSSISHRHPDRLYLWESTARGPNEWKTMWDEAKADDLNQTTVFIGWWALLEQSLARGTPQFARYGSDPPNDDEKRKIAEVKELYGFEVSQEQLAWYRYFADPSREGDDGAPSEEDGLIQQDQPWTEYEAFVLTGASFFSSQKLTELSFTTASSKFSAYRFVPGVDFVRSAVYPARNYRDIEYKIWEEPVIGASYVVGVDPAYGHSEKNDRSAIEVVKCYADGMEQVAEYISGSIEPSHLAWVMWTLVGYYGSKAGLPVVPIIELNGPGEAVWKEAQAVRQQVLNGYLNRAAEEKGLADLFRNVRQYIYQRSDSLTHGTALHMKTTSQLKVAYMERLRSFVHNGELVVRSMDLLRDMQVVTRDGDAIEAAGRGHDDRVVAIALCGRVWDDRLRRTLIAQNRTRMAEKARLALAQQDQYALFQRYQLDQFFRRNDGVRGAMARQAIRAAAEARRRY